MDKTGYAYVPSSKGKRRYIGVTSELQARVGQHKTRVHAGCLIARYNIDQLVYCECFPTLLQAIARESALKNMSPLRKIEPIPQRGVG